MSSKVNYTVLQGLFSQPGEKDGTASGTLSNPSAASGSVAGGASPLASVVSAPAALERKRAEAAAQAAAAGEESEEYDEDEDEPPQLTDPRAAKAHPSAAQGYAQFGEDDDEDWE